MKNTKEVQKQLINKKMKEEQKQQEEKIENAKMFAEEFQVFQKEMVVKYGLMIGCRLQANAEQIKAVLVPIEVPMQTSEQLNKTEEKNDKETKTTKKSK